MAIEEDDPPPDGPNRVGNAVASLYSAGRPPGMGEAGGEAVDVSSPIPIYGLEAPHKDSTPATLLTRVHRIGWRYLVSLGPTTSVADIKREDNAAPELIRSSALVDRIINASAYAEKAIDNDASYHLRLLDLSVIGQVVLWLVSDSKKPDRFFSIDKQAREIDANKFLAQMSVAERQKAASMASDLDESGG
jgi:hypothetical protein